jgi:hypothetical protein
LLFALFARKEEKLIEKSLIFPWLNRVQIIQSAPTGKQEDQAM